MDTFDYKPQRPEGRWKGRPGRGRLDRFEVPPSSRHGETGTVDLRALPAHVARHVDQLCFIRGLHTDTPAHPEAVIQLHTGTALASARRGLRWAPGCSTGWGRRTRIVPGFVTINPPPNFGGAVNYGSAFLPAHFQGTRDRRHRVRAQPEGTNRGGRSSAGRLELIQSLNRDLTARTPGAPEAARRRDPVLRAGVPDAGRKVPDAARHLEASLSQGARDAYGVKPGPEPGASPASA